MPWEGLRGGGGGVPARGGEEDEPQRGKAAHLEVEDGDGEEDEEDVGRCADHARGGNGGCGNGGGVVVGWFRGGLGCGG